MNDTEVSLNTDNQPSGIYFLEVKTTQGIVYKKLNLIK